MCRCWRPKWPKRHPRGPRKPPGAPQEASKSAPGGPKRPRKTRRTGQEGSKPTQELRRASQDAHKAFPKHLARQPFSENSKNLKHGSKRHRRCLRSPVSMNPQGFASNRRMKKGGRAAVVPLGEVNPPPAPQGRGLRRVGHLDAIAEVVKAAEFLAIDLCILLQIFFGGVF